MLTVILLIISNVFMVIAWYGHGQFTTTQLKVIQMIVTLVVFSVFVVTYLGEPLAWNHFVAFVLLIAAGFFVFGFDKHSDAPNSMPTLTVTPDPLKHEEPTDSKLPH